MKKIECLAFVMCLLTISCSHDNHNQEIPVDPKIEPEISLSEKSVAFTSYGGGQLITVSANTIWKVEFEENDWYLAFAAEKTHNGGTIMINVRPNYNSTVERTGKISVIASSNEIIKEITITQHKADSIIPWINKVGELDKHNKEKMTISQGIGGTVLLREGNCMQFGGGAWNSCRIFPIQREVLVYEYTTIEQVTYLGTPVFYSGISTQLFATTTCDKEGFLELELEPGNYSVFVREKGQLYASRFDGVGGINPITVESAQVAEPYLWINYAAD